MVLLHYVIQVFALADFNPFVFIVIVLLDSGSVGAAFVDVNQTGLSSCANSFIKKPACSLCVTLRSE